MIPHKKQTYEFTLECGHGGYNIGCTCMVENGLKCVYCKIHKKCIKVRPIIEGSEEWKRLNDET